MINAIKYSDMSFEPQFTPLVNEAYEQAKALLGNLPEDVDIVFTDQGASELMGVGGFAESADQINLCIQKGFRNRELQWRNLYGTVMHESFHLQQGFTFDKAPFTALESSIYEGCAVVFEREYSESSVEYADYSRNTDEQLQGWADEIESVGTRYFEDTETWERWAFYHPEYDQQWIIYKVGSWMVDRVLRENQLQILDLQNSSAQQILSGVKAL